MVLSQENDAGAFSGGHSECAFAPALAGFVVFKAAQRRNPELRPLTE